MNDKNNKIDVKQFMKLLGLTSFADEVDEDLIIESSGESDNEIYIKVSKQIKPVYCPRCNSRMYSKGSITRKVKHPILQNGKTLVVILSQRKYRCTNNICNLYLNEDFGFVEKYKQISSMTPYMILNDMKDITLTCAAVSRRYQVSDTYVHSIMMRYLQFSSLPLSRIISIDEVYLDIEYDKRYVVVIRDFINDDIIEILPNRYENTIRQFFLSYSLEERSKVEYVISDMYNPYIYATQKYLPAGENIIDSFHIVEFINRSIRAHINTVKKRYIEKLNKERKDNNFAFNKNYKSRKDSPELYLLKRHDWVLLSKPGNEPNISSKHYCRELNIYPTIERIQKMFMELDPYFEVYKQLKDKYLNFNDSYIGKVDEAAIALDKLIKEYQSSSYSLFQEFADLLIKYKPYIINSFTVIKKQKYGTEYYQRLSNGPMEGFNRKPKDMKRMARGFTNFDFVRNRILFSCRKNASILAIPKDSDYLKQNYKGKPRGKYKTHKN